MALTPISNSVEFVQDTVPTTAADGDSWLDTSLSPPRLKIFDASAGSFIEPRSIQNLDAAVSAAGAELRFIGGFQLSVASFLQSFSVSRQDSSPRGVAFNSDGTLMFVIGRGSDSVHQYSLTTGFDIGTASFTGSSFDISGQASAVTGVAFSGDGTSMFVIGDTTDSVFQYSLTTGFDIGTASFTGSSFDVSGQDGIPTGVAFSADGTSMFIIGNSSDSVFQYSLTTGFDIGTASFSGTSFDVSVQASRPRDVAFSGDGTSMFVIGNNSDSVFQYSLTTGFDIGTASFTGSSFDVSGQDNAPRDVAFSADGTSMFVTGSNSDSVHQYLVGEVGPK